MNYEDKIKLGRFIIALVIAGIGVTLVWVNANAWVVVGVVLMLWSNNIEKATFK